MIQTRPFRSWAFIGAMTATIVGCTAGYANLRDHNRIALQRIEVGMTKEQVLQTIGPSTQKDVPNPYRTESYRAGNQRIEVLFFYSDWKQGEGAITDDELMPVVLIDGKVDGWGWTYWENTASRYSIILRSRP